MIIIVDDREIVTAGYASAFDREGYASLELHSSELVDWLNIAPDTDLRSIEAVLLGESADRLTFPAQIRKRCSDAQIIALEDTSSLERTLDLFAAEVDDVLRKPVHVKEILARVGAFRRRLANDGAEVSSAPIQVFYDGRDPQVGGDVMELPRRERRILEYLARNQGRRVTKSQIFNSVYGMMNDGVDECVVESHISKLRKKLRMRLGEDPIESTRYIGYMLKPAFVDGRQKPATREQDNETPSEWVRASEQTRELVS